MQNSQINQNQIDNKIFGSYKIIEECKQITEQSTDDGGDNIQHLIVKFFNHWIQIPENELQKFPQIFAILNNATKLIYGIQTTNNTEKYSFSNENKLFNNSLTLNCASFYFIKVLQNILQIVPNGEAFSWTKIYNENIKLLIQGMFLDNYWSKSAIYPTENDFEQIIIFKYGSILRFSAHLMQLFAKNEQNFDKLILHLTMFIKLSKDLAQLKVIKKNTSNSNILSSKKLLLPIIHSINCNLENKTFLKLLKQPNLSQNSTNYILQTLNNCGSLDYVQQKLESLKTQIQIETEQLGGNPFLDELINFIYL